jgi:hypothetical protein
VCVLFVFFSCFAFQTMASESQSSAAADTAVAAADVKQSSWVSFFKEAGLDEFPSSTQAAMMKQLDDEMFSPTPRILSELKANPALLNSFWMACRTTLSL